MPERELLERGATMVEYAIMVALIALVALLAVAALGISVRDIFSNDALQDALL